MITVYLDGAEVPGVDYKDRLAKVKTFERAAREEAVEAAVAAGVVRRAHAGNFTTTELRRMTGNADQPKASRGVKGVQRVSGVAA